jgi:O-acetyl-ADP-ribose deacetylase (regulator of RNase III)
MNLHLVGQNPSLVDAWRHSFHGFPEVEIAQADILTVARHCFVSPANSHGFMDGGIDASYRAFFDPGIECTVREAILLRPEQMLPVGASLVVQTGHPRIPYLIVAPTMEMPEPVPPIHSARALRAVLRLVGQHPELGDDIYCPGLGTGVGQIDAAAAAEQMASTYRDWIRGSRG